MDFARFQDTPAVRILRLLADLLAVNLLVLLCFIPIVPAGAAFSAMYAVLMERERTGTVSVLKIFYTGLKTGFLRGTAFAGIFLALLIVAATDVFFGLTNTGMMQTVYIAVGVLLGMIGLVVFTLPFAQQAVFRNSLKGILKNSLLLAVSMPGKSLLMWAAWIIPYALAVWMPDVFVIRFGFIYLMFGLSGPAWVTVKLANQMFQKVEKSSE